MKKRSSYAQAPHLSFTAPNAEVKSEDLPRSEEAREQEDSFANDEPVRANGEATVQTPREGEESPVSEPPHELLIMPGKRCEAATSDENATGIPLPRVAIPEKAGLRRSRNKEGNVVRAQVTNRGLRKARKLGAKHRLHAPHAGAFLSRLSKNGKQRKPGLRRGARGSARITASNDISRQIRAAKLRHSRDTFVAKRHAFSGAVREEENVQVGPEPVGALFVSETVQDLNVPSVPTLEDDDAQQENPGVATSADTIHLSQMHLMAEATLVREEEQPETRQQASIVNSDVLERAQLGRQMARNYRRCGMGLVVTAVLVVVVSVAVYLQTNGSTEEVAGLESEAIDKANESFTGIPPDPNPDPFYRLLDGLPDFTIEALTEPLSPQHDAFEWLKNHPNAIEFDPWKQKQLFALATYYYSLSGGDWPDHIKDDWMDYGRDECNWYSSNYVTKEEHTAIPHITNNGSSMCYESGPLRGRLYHLGLGNARRIKGTIPPEISLLPSLKSLVFQNCEWASSFANAFPWPQLQILSDLSTIHVYQGNLYGTLPSQIALLTQLRKMELYHNDLSGTIATEIVGMTALASLHLGSTSINGTIPPQLGLVTSLEHLDMSWTDLSGPIPSQMGLLSSLQWMYLEGTYLSGKVPSHLAELTSLKWIWLHNTDISGPLPTEIGLAPSLQRLYLSSTHLSGTIPSHIGLLSSSLEQLYLGATDLSGNIPTELGLLSLLQKFSFSETNVYGSLPSEIGSLSSLESLRLVETDISGNIPSQLALLASSLESIDLRSTNNREHPK